MALIIRSYRIIGCNSAINILFARILFFFSKRKNIYPVTQQLTDQYDTFFYYYFNVPT